MKLSKARSIVSKVFTRNFPVKPSGGSGEAENVCHACLGSGVERWDRGLPERCSLCKGYPYGRGAG